MKERIRQYIVDDLLDGRPVDYNEDLLLSGLVDSLGVMRLVSYLEDSLHTPVPPEDITIDNFASIDTIAAYVSAHAQ